MSLHVVHVVAGLWKDTGGPAEVIPNLCRAQVEAGAKVTLCSIDGDTAPQVDALRSSGVEVRLFRAFDSTIRYSPDMAHYLRSLGAVDIIHNHGHWLWPNWCASAMSQKLDSALVTTPHGTLVPGMLARASMKKWLAWSLFDSRLVARASVIHALSPAERDAMSAKLGRHASKIRVIPNGVSIATNSGQYTADDAGTLLFLSRVAPIKGVTQLLLAWQRLAPRFPEWRLKIVGPIDPAIKAEVTTLCASSERAELTGPIYQDERWEQYRDAAAFILPTFGEGLPTVLLEAAAHQLPVITTKEANFDELHQAGGSILTLPHVNDLTLTLSNFLSLPGQERRAIGLRGGALIEANYKWSTIAARWLSTYSEIRSQILR